MNNFTYIHKVTPESVKVVASNGELTINITGEGYGMVSVIVTGDDITGIARALGNVTVRPKAELLTV